MCLMRVQVSEQYFSEGLEVKKRHVFRSDLKI